MDQDFHYYGTYQAAIMSRWTHEEAILTAKAADFVDFMNEVYRGYWEIKNGNYIVGRFNAPRYTFQANFSGNVVGAKGLWAAFHFLPGNYADPPNTPALYKTHTHWAIELLMNGQHSIRAVKPLYQTVASLLTRPMSAASRYIVEDTVRLSQNYKDVTDILINAPAAYYLLPKDKIKREKIIKKFIIILAGLRAHVICDTYAHQDWACIPSDINTYWDNSDSWKDFATNRGDAAIKYSDVGIAWKPVVLRSTNLKKNPNLSASPNILGNLGHGWMGHLPDFSFIKYKYRPAWDANKTEYLRDNPLECKYAFIEMLNMFHRMRLVTDRGFNDKALHDVEEVIKDPMDITANTPFPRAHSAAKWRNKFTYNHTIDVRQESPPDPDVVLSGKHTYKKTTGDLLGKTAYGTFTLDLKDTNNDISELYLFMIAADYHFHFVRDWLIQKNIFNPDDSWSTAEGPLSFAIHDVITKRFTAIEQG